MEVLRMQYSHLLSLCPQLTEELCSEKAFKNTDKGKVTLLCPEVHTNINSPIAKTFTQNSLSTWNSHILIVLYIIITPQNISVFKLVFIIYYKFKLFRLI